jgi:DnaJ-class molecular chaperone
MKLVGEYITRACGECRGMGWVRLEPTFSCRGGKANAAMQRGTGHKVPCPKCLGKKVESLKADLKFQI